MFNEVKIGKVKHCSTLTEYFAISKAYPDESQLIFMLIKKGPIYRFPTYCQLSNSVVLWVLMEGKIHI